VYQRFFNGIEAYHRVSISLKSKFYIFCGDDIVDDIQGELTMQADKLLAV